MFSKEQLFKIFRNNSDIGVVFRYKGNPPFESNTHHVFIILCKMKDNNLLLVNGTSRYDKKFNILEKMGQEPSKTLVTINPGEYDFFPLKTAIDCNTVHKISLDNLNIEDFEYILNRKLKSKDLSKIIQGIKNSHTVPLHIKNILDQ